MRRRFTIAAAETGPVRILLIEDSPSDAQLLKLLLRSDSEFEITTATKLARGISLLGEGGFDIVLLDLSLPDGSGIDTVRRAHCAASSIPIVVLTGLADEALAIEALREGAQDYLIKGEIDRQLLVRVIRYACERQRLIAALQGLALRDTLTGLYNRRGFVTIAEEQLKLAHRMGHSAALAFIDLDGMKRINDELGHEAGDQALIDTAEVLRSTFRASDVIARLGGDEFIVLAIAARHGAISRLYKRLRQSLERHNEMRRGPPLSFSVGFAHYNPLISGRTTIEQLMTEADQAMYVEKQTHRASRTFQDNAQGHEPAPAGSAGR